MSDFGKDDTREPPALRRVEFRLDTKRGGHPIFGRHTGYDLVDRKATIQRGQSILLLIDTGWPGAKGGRLCPDFGYPDWDWRRDLVFQILSVFFTESAPKLGSYRAPPPDERWRLAALEYDDQEDGWRVVIATEKKPRRGR